MVYKIVLYLYNIFIFIAIIILYIVKIISSNKVLQDRFLSYKKQKQVIDFWFHGASVGEILSVKSFIANLKYEYPNCKILITIQSKNAYILLNKVFTNIANVEIVFLPYDSPFLINKFLKIYNPKIAFWIEQEFLPNILSIIKKNNIPLILLNARMFDKSYNIWKNFKFIITKILQNFTAIYAMSKNDEVKYKALTKIPVHFIGNLKYTALNKDYNLDIYNVFKNLLNNKIVFLALSTHYNEEEEIAKVHIKLKQQYPNLITIIIPRHISRIQDIQKSLNKLSINSLIYKQNNDITKLDEKTDIILINAMGLVNTFIMLSNFVFIGKSLSEKHKGGHNIVEPLYLGACVVFGSNMQNFLQMTEDALNYNCAKEVKSFTELDALLGELILKPNLAKELRDNTSKMFTSNVNILDNLKESLKCYIDIS
jgi:3-deoxy-D-manno-octulosonic-acid transferase